MKISQPHASGTSPALNRQACDLPVQARRQRRRPDEPQPAPTAGGDALNHCGGRVLGMVVDNDDLEKQRLRCSSKDRSAGAILRPRCGRER